MYAQKMMNPEVFLYTHDVPNQTKRRLSEGDVKSGCVFGRYLILLLYLHALLASRVLKIRVLSYPKDHRI
jgi:hypothetical protein